VSKSGYGPRHSHNHYESEIDTVLRIVRMYLSYHLINLILADVKGDVVYRMEWRIPKDQKQNKQML
jgi:hypothetical protein